MFLIFWWVGRLGHKPHTHAALWGPIFLCFFGALVSTCSFWVLFDLPICLYILLLGGKRCPIRSDSWEGWWFSAHINVHIYICIYIYIYTYQYVDTYMRKIDAARARGLNSAPGGVHLSCYNRIIKNHETCIYVYILYWSVYMYIYMRKMDAPKARSLNPAPEGGQSFWYTYTHIHTFKQYIYIYQDLLWFRNVASHPPIHPPTSPTHSPASEFI